jgi:hypothetical protein
MISGVLSPQLRILVRVPFHPQKQPTDTRKTAGIAEKLLDACVEHLVSPYMDGNMAEELDGAFNVGMDADELGVGFASGVGDSEAGPSAVERLYEEYISGGSQSSSPKPWAGERSSDDFQIIEVEEVPAHFKGEREDTAKLWEIEEVSKPPSSLLRSSFSLDI